MTEIAPAQVVGLDFQSTVEEKKNFPEVMNQSQGNLPLENCYHHFAAWLLLSPSLATWSSISQMTFQLAIYFLPTSLLTHASILKN